ncbi:hypothetical protein [Rhodococcus sp. NPDC057529]|uniref:hypothetical protein n=1 Tax=Rhodococcus sp. NPDC057529 TaxID=3346158 RepID=UPI003671CFA1
MHTPYAPTPLTSQFVAPISPDRHSPTRGHRPGRAKLRRSNLSPELGAESIELDQSYCDRGIQARRTARDALMDVTNILDGIEDEADKLLADLHSLLDQSGAD